jgi:hypothetical protein
MLEEIAVPEAVALVQPQRVAKQLMDEADRRIERFTREHRPPIDNFVVCDFALVDAALRWITEQNLLCGSSFCEWGSGFGVVTMLAALQEFDACGIEVEAALVRQAEQLADDFQLDARFARGSFIPDGGEDLVEFLEDIAHIETDTPSGYEDLEREIADFDLFFAFPWPGEHGYWESVFDHFAADGAMLLTYQGIEQLRLQRHIA